jgi:serine protease
LAGGKSTHPDERFMIRKFCCNLLTACVLLSVSIPLALAQTATAGPAASDARVIVKFKTDSPMLRKDLSTAAAQQTSQADALGTRVGLALRTGMGVAERTQVVYASGMSSEQLAQRLAAESDIEFAVPDQRRHRLSAPNDPLYVTGPPISGLTGGPVAGQWYLRAPAGDVQSSINAEPAWALLSGGANIVVAVIDTGVRFDHPDLLRAGAGGNLLPGYDMISDATVANDGDGRDTDPSDPGDWLTLAEVQQTDGPFYQCDTVAENSSWHGTQTSGLVGALANNGIGMAGVGRNVQVLPVRVLGKCGGYDSDIIAGMLWAAGFPVPGVPANPNPARVLNLSLGGDGACTSAYSDAVAQINAAGVVVVVAGGNSSGHALGTPANCTGVIAVTGLRHFGTKVGFSDLGPGIGIGAPAGNCVNTGASDPCLYPILSTSNSGLTNPVATAAGGAIYTDSFNASLGTSFSAPLVAGTAALMLSARPALTPAQVLALMQSNARPFPTTGSSNSDGTPVPQCTVPQPLGATQIDQLECYCTTSTCGAGMLDAGAAVLAAFAGLQAHIDVTSGSPQAGAVVTLDATQSVAVNGNAISAYQWALVDGGGIVTGFTGATNGATASLSPSGAGNLSIRLTVTDSAGGQSSTVLVVTVSAAPGPVPNYGGVWWNAPAGSESGWGINIAHQGDVLFVSWFTYDAGGHAWWLSMTANKNADGTYSGTFYQTSGPAFNAVPFDPNKVTRTFAGTGTFTFSSGTSGTFAYTINGIAQSKAIVLQQFGTLPVCVWGAQSNLALATNYQDLWWVPGGVESGWGLNLAQQGTTIFAGWFTYDVNGNAIWYSVSAPMTTANTFVGALYRTSGPAFSAVPFNPGLVQRTAVGTATFNFSDGNTGTFAYQLHDGANIGAQTKAITRLVFRAPGTVCQ